MTTRPSYSFIAWTTNVGRARDISADLGGEAYCPFPFKSRTAPTTLLRYAVSVVLTLAYLVRRRPHAVIVTNPPIFPALVVWAWSRASGVPFALDSHPTSFGAKDHRVSQRLLPVHRWLARRAAAVLVTAPEWVDEVERWGGRGLIVHEPPIGWAGDGSTSNGEVLYVGTFAGDEPFDVVVQAAGLLGDRKINATGDLHRCPPELMNAKPDNLRLTGYLNGSQYYEAMNSASAVVVLTTEPTSVMRAAYEAVWCQKPLVVSDTPLLRETFPLANFAANEGAALAAAITDALEGSDHRSRAFEAHEQQSARWKNQRDQLMNALAP